jgi:hypothetical protein
MKQSTIIFTTLNYIYQRTYNADQFQTEWCPSTFQLLLGLDFDVVLCRDLDLLKMQSLIFGSNYSLTLKGLWYIHLHEKNKL